jgi:hypothetical protein
MDRSDDSAKKQIPLRVSAALWRELAEWAQDDFRSINGQIEYLLSECVRERRKKKRGAARPSSAKAGDSARPECINRNESKE